jgi:hypothetical protein
MPKFTKEIIAASLLLGILCICYYGFLPESTRMITHSALVILFGIVAALLWHNKPADEREQNHQMISAQVAFTAGGLVLVAAIVYAGLVDRHVEPVIYWAFGAMLIGKVGGQLWAERFR